MRLTRNGGLLIHIVVFFYVNYQYSVEYYKNTSLYLLIIYTYLDNTNGNKHEMKTRLRTALEGIEPATIENEQDEKRDDKAHNVEDEIEILRKKNLLSTGSNETQHFSFKDI